MSKRVQKTVTGLLVAALCVGSLAGAPDRAEAKKKASIKKKNITIVKGKSKKITNAVIRLRAATKRLPRFPKRER